MPIFHERNDRCLFAFLFFLCRNNLHTHTGALRVWISSVYFSSFGGGGYGGRGRRRQKKFWVFDAEKVFHTERKKEGSFSPFEISSFHGKREQTPFGQQAGGKGRMPLKRKKKKMCVCQDVHSLTKHAEGTVSFLFFSFLFFKKMD